MKTFLRILIIAAILLILVFLSIGIVRVVPKALSSLASATVSIGSVFGGGSHATSTATTTSSTVGFINTSTSTTGYTENSTTTVSTGTSTGVSTYPTNSYIPKPGSNTGSNNGYTTGSYTPTCAANGTSDVAVSIMSYGVINSAGQFVTTSSFTTGDMVSVRFKVENRGTCTTGPWTLHVQMPAQNTADQVRDLNGAALPAGAAVTGQANFTSPRSGSSAVTITVADTSGRDSNSSDNTASAALSVVAGNTNTGGGTYTYPTTGTFPVSGDGRPDLMVRVVQVGTLDYNNNFIPTSNQNFPVGARAAVQFEVINQGLNASGGWTFRADVNDAYQPRTYQDPQTENSIPSGGSSLYTVSFDGLSAGQHTLTLTADSYNQVNEFNEGNNTLGVNFYINY